MVATIRVALWFAGAAMAAAGARAGTVWQAVELGHSEMAIWTEPQTRVYRDAGSFRSAWSQLYPVAGLRPVLPAIDFRTRRVIITSVGTKPTGGYRLTLEDGQAMRNSAVLTVTIHTPPRNCAVTQELTMPAIAIATPLSPVRFRIIYHERADSALCG
jgi:hypothetical protein